jgi:hypothetical protein
MLIDERDELFLVGNPVVVTEREFALGEFGILLDAIK